MVELAPWPVDALIGVGTEKVALSLEEIGRQSFGAQTVIVGKSRRQAGCGNAVTGGEADYPSQVGLGGPDLAAKGRGEEEVG